MCNIYFIVYWQCPDLSSLLWGRIGGHNGLVFIVLAWDMSGGFVGLHIGLGASFLMIVFRVSHVTLVCQMGTSYPHE